MFLAVVCQLLLSMLHHITLHHAHTFIIWGVNCEWFSFCIACGGIRELPAMQSHVGVPA